MFSVHIDFFLFFWGWIILKRAVAKQETSRTFIRAIRHHILLLVQTETIWGCTSFRSSALWFIWLMIFFTFSVWNWCYHSYINAVLQNSEVVSEKFPVEYVALHIPSRCLMIQVFLYNHFMSIIICKKKTKMNKNTYQQKKINPQM